jgi:predicted RNA methylase
VVAANGLGGRIKLIAKHSTDLRIGPDLSERAEVLVTEVFGTAAINELVIPTVMHAHAQLLQPGATVVPNAASVGAYLAGAARRWKAISSSSARPVSRLPHSMTSPD